MNKRQKKQLQTIILEGYKHFPIEPLEEEAQKRGLEFKKLVEKLSEESLLVWAERVQITLEMM